MPARTISQWIQLPYIKKLSHETRDFLLNLIMAADEEGFLVIDAKMIPKMFDTTRTHVDPAKEEAYFQKNLGALTEFDENGSTLIIFSRKVLPSHAMRTNYIWVQRWRQICRSRYQMAVRKLPPNPTEGDQIIHGNLPSELVSIQIPSSPLDALLRQTQRAHEISRAEDVAETLQVINQAVPRSLPNSASEPITDVGTEELATFFTPIDVSVDQTQLDDPYASIIDPLGGLGDPLQMVHNDAHVTPPSEDDHQSSRFDASKVIESLGQSEEWPQLVQRVGVVLAKIGMSTTDSDIRGLLTATEREPRAAIRFLEMVDISDPEFKAQSGVGVLRKVWDL